MVVIVTSFLNVTPIDRVLNNKFSVLLGKISLPMYITHYTFINFWFAQLMKIKGDLMFKMMYSPSAASLYKFLEGTGGYDKNLDYTQLAEYVSKNVKNIVVSILLSI